MGVGGGAGRGGIHAAGDDTFHQFDVGGAQGGDEILPSGAIPSRGIGLLACDALQGVGGDRAGADRTGFNERDFQQMNPVESCGE